MKLPFECAILGALMKRPMHGYDIHKFLSTALKGVWYVGMSNMYNMLKKLEAHGYVSSTIEANGNRPARRVFNITQKGESLFKDWIAKPVDNIRDLRVEFIAKLYFLRDLRLSGGVRLIERQKVVCRKILDSSELSTPKRSDFLRLLYDFKSCQIKSILSWLEDCVEFLKSPSAKT
ncbi:MAG: hypothetical protein GTN81_17565 [Proteobacteria bacterium]|nr:hypothetical protein [Pseudomonadota bacterium]